MITMEKIRRDFGGNICRRCINETYRVQLRSHDCWYEYYPHACPRCKEIQNTVNDLKLPAKLRLLLKYYHNP